MKTTGIEEYYTCKDGKKLRFGYTTGTCAAAAAKAAATALLTGTVPADIPILTPKGILLHLPVEESACMENCVRCAVKKYSGDDPDVTNGVLVWAEVSLREDREIVIDGGTGVGRVTKPGLQQPVGAAAINRIPRQMIQREVYELLEQADSPYGAKITISIPAGVELAKRTFNPRLGIEGGISVLGTSGIVEPMSETALLESIHLEMCQKKALGAGRLLLAPGNYGVDFLHALKRVEDCELVKCSNYLGAALDMAVEEGFGEILLISHIGKVIKVAGGVMNTHSRVADARGEIMAACALRAGCGGDLARAVLDCVTTDEMLNVLDVAGWLEQTLRVIGERVQYYLTQRTGGEMRIGAIIFSNERGILQTTGPAAEWLRELADREENRK